MAHLHEVRDADTHFTIDAETMVITNTNAAKNKLRVGDHNSEVLTFEIPRYIENHDVLLCDKIGIHYMNAGTNKVDVSKDVYWVTDAAVSEEDENIVLFSWLVSGNATKYVGLLSFGIMFGCLEEDNTYSYVKNTEIFSGITISDGYNFTEAVVEQYSDVLEQEFDELKKQMEELTKAFENDFSQLSEDKVNLPIDDEGKIQNGNSGQILETNGDGTTKWVDKPEGVKDGVVTIAKLSPDLQKSLGVADLDIYGFTEDDYTAVDITDLFTPANYSTWVESSNTASGTVLSPIFKTPAKLKIVNNHTSAEISNRYTRFLDGEDVDTATEYSFDMEYTRSDRWNTSIAAGETKTIYTHEWGRTGLEYMQIRWTNGSFSGWKGNFQVIAYYTDKRPVYTNELDINDGFEHDVDIKWCGAVNGNPNLTNATVFAVVPFVPNRKYTIKGGMWTNSLSTNISGAFAFYDDSVLDNYYPSLYGDSGSMPAQPPVRNILKEVNVIENGATNGGKGIVTYICPDPAETNDYPKWVAFAMSSAAKPAVADNSVTYFYDDTVISEWMSSVMLEMSKSNPAWHYVTVFDEPIDRPVTTVQFVKPYMYHNDAGSRHAAMLSSVCPLAGATLTVFGDSISDVYGGHDLTSECFISKICREFGMKIDNRAASGSNMCISTDAYASVSGIYKLDEMLAEIESGNINAPEYVLIEFGSNCYDTYVGQETDTSEVRIKSYYGAFRYFIEQLRSKCPNTVFGFILPHDVDWGTNSVSKAAGVPLCREALRSLCTDYRVPYIDMYTESGITSDMLSDGVHIGTEQAQNLYYHAVRRFVMGL